MEGQVHPLVTKASLIVLGQTGQWTVLLTKSELALYQHVLLVSYMPEVFLASVNQLYLVNKCDNSLQCRDPTTIYNTSLLIRSLQQLLASTPREDNGSLYKFSCLPNYIIGSWLNYYYVSSLKALHYHVKVYVIMAAWQCSTTVFHSCEEGT